MMRMLDYQSDRAFVLHPCASDPCMMSMLCYQSGRSFVLHPCASHPCMMSMLDDQSDLAFVLDNFRSNRSGRRRRARSAQMSSDRVRFDREASKLAFSECSVIKTSRSLVRVSDVSARMCSVIKISRFSVIGQRHTFAVRSQPPRSPVLTM